VQRFEDILQVIIPIFDSYTLQTTKVLDFMDFRAAVIQKKYCGSLTPPGGGYCYYFKP